MNNHINYNTITFRILGQYFSLGTELGLKMGHQLGLYTIWYPKQELHHYMLNSITKTVWDTLESLLDQLGPQH